MEIHINCPEIDIHVNNLIDYIRQYSSSLAGTINGESTTVPLNTILYIESVDRRTFFYDEKRAFRSSETLSALEMKLDNSLFERISKSCIVNLTFIDSTYTAGNHKIGVLLKNGERLMAGRRYASSLVQKLRSYNMSTENGSQESKCTSIKGMICSIRNDNRILHFDETPGE